MNETSGVYGNNLNNRTDGQTQRQVQEQPATRIPSLFMPPGAGLDAATATATGPEWKARIRLGLGVCDGWAGLREGAYKL